MGFFGFGNAMRRKAIKQENAFDYADRVTKGEGNTNANARGFVSYDTYKEKASDYALKQYEKKIVAKSKEKIKAKRKARLEPYEKAFGAVFKYRPNRPGKLKVKAVKKLCRSPFGR